MTAQDDAAPVPPATVPRDPPEPDAAAMGGLPLLDPAAGSRLPDLAAIAAVTSARLSLGRAGAAVPTRTELAFLLDHARARAAVWSEVDWDRLAAALEASGMASVRVASAAPDRATYVRRPDLGRRLADGTALELSSNAVALVVGDGLSATAVTLNAAALAAALSRRLGPLSPVVLAERARVALGDPIGVALGARVVVVLIGERPGLSASDSLGAYLTYAPAPGTPDSRRNCVSNIRDGGLPIERAADVIATLVAAMLSARLSGVALQPHLPALPG